MARLYRYSRGIFFVKLFSGGLGKGLRASIACLSGCSRRNQRRSVKTPNGALCLLKMFDYRDCHTEIWHRTFFSSALLHHILAILHHFLLHLLNHRQKTLLDFHTESEPQRTRVCRS